MCWKTAWTPQKQPPEKIATSSPAVDASSAPSFAAGSIVGALDPRPENIATPASATPKTATPRKTDRIM
jgi:hypothetical protein